MIVGAVARESRPFVGRERELDELSVGLEAAVSGRGSVFLVLGEAGVGKTSLAEAFAARATAEGVSALWGRCWETGGAPAYWPWIQVVRSHLRGHEREHIADELGTGAVEIARIVPELRDLFPELKAPQLEPEAARFALFDAMSAFLRKAADAKPLLLVLDDLHTADHESLLLLEFVARELRDAPLIAVGTYRAVETRRAPSTADPLAQIAREGRSIPLRGFSKAQIASFIEEVTGVSPGGPLVEALHDATEGNPFFVEELVRLLAAEGLLEAEGAPKGGFPLPEGVRQTIAHHLDSVSGGCRRTLGLASVVGREFALGLLEQVSDARRAELLEQLGEAERAGLVVERSAALGRYGFSHALIRETLYAQLASVARIEYHRTVGEGLERLYGHDLEPHLAELAHHFFEAAQDGGADKAIDYCERAGHREMRQLAYEQAAAHYERALAGLDLEIGGGDERRRLELRLALADAQMNGVQTAGARECYRAAAEIAKKLGAPDELARAALGFGAQPYFSGGGQPDEDNVRLLEDALQALPDEDSTLRATVLGRLSEELYFSPSSEDRRRTKQLANQALDMSKRVGGPVPLSVLMARHGTLLGPDPPAERLADAAEIVRHGEETGNGEMVLCGRVWRVNHLLEIGDLAGVDAEIAAFTRLADRIRLRPYRYWPLLWKAMRALLEGRFDDAERLAIEAAATGDELHGDVAANMFSAQIFALRVEQGRVAELEPAIKAAVEQFGFMPVWRAALAVTCAQLGQRERAQAELERVGAEGFAAVPEDVNWLLMTSLLAETCALLGDAEHASSLYELLEPAGERCVAVAWGGLCLGAVSFYLGLLATTLERWKEAEEHFEDAIERNARLGSPPYVARTECEYARMLLARANPGDRERALELARRSLASAEALGMRAVAAAAATLAAEGEQEEPAAESVFRLSGDYWTIAYRGTESRLKDSKGLRYIADLLANPNREISALELAAGAGEGEQAAPGAVAAGEVGGSVRAGLGDAGELLDDQAKAAYRRRLEELREELEQAEAFNDPERIAAAREQIDFLQAELARAVGLGGRDRRAASPAERARVNVTRSIKEALKRIGEENEPLGAHLGGSIKTGANCCYLLGPDARISWHL